jgi:subtilisin family serine protease
MGDDPLLRDAVAHAVEKGVGVVAATGNEGVSVIYYPARYPGVIAVSAVDASGQYLYFANRGPEVDVAAPGLSVRAAGPGNGLSLFSGTSAAVPFVSGAAAALLSQQPDLGLADVERLLSQYADDVGLPGRDAYTGSGVLDLGRLQERGRVGVYDAAAGEPVVRKFGDRLMVVVSAQNRGTEVLRRLRLLVNLDGAPQEYVFQDVAVGQTVSQTMPLGAGILNAGGVVVIGCVAVIDGQTDARPFNDRSAVEVRLDGR